MVRLGVLYTPNHGSSPCEQTTKIKILKKLLMNKLYFTSDLHFGHKNILHYTPNRCADIGVKCNKVEDQWVYTDLPTNTEINEEEAIKRMDCFIINKWNSIIDKKDEVYILGDFSFYGVEETQKIFQNCTERNI